uniref:Astacin domain-containing protein n=1 Tax=Parastrongyloides trichosuri TaxID=131310 RepID=A0A0N4ZAP9_PARTI
MWVSNFLFLAYFFYSSFQDEIDDDRVNLTQLVKNFTRSSFTPVSQVVLICNEENTLSDYIFSDIINFFNRTACIQFQNVTKNMTSNKKYFNLIIRRANLNTIDETKNLTTIQLNKICSEDDVCIRYFFGLALGMIPQVNRQNRETYVHVIYTYVNTSDQFRYNKLSSPLFKNQNYSFDFGSFFNRNPYYCSKNKMQTYTPKNYISYYAKMLGQRIDYSFGDRRTFCNYYDNKTLSKVTCKNGGFYNPKKKDCICPDGYIGKYCSTLQQMPKCGNQTYISRKKENYIFACGKKICYFEINSKSNKSTRIDILAVNTKNITPCVSYDALEVRYLEDKGVTGLSLCGHYNNTISLTSFSNKVFIGYNGGNDDYFLLSYKTSEETNEKSKKKTKKQKKEKEKSNDDINSLINISEISNLDELNCTKLKKLEHLTNLT